MSTRTFPKWLIVVLVVGVFVAVLARRGVDGKWREGTVLDGAVVFGRSGEVVGGG